MKKPSVKAVREDGAAQSTINKAERAVIRAALKWKRYGGHAKWTCEDELSRALDTLVAAMAKAKKDKS